MLCFFVILGTWGEAAFAAEPVTSSKACFFTFKSGAGVKTRFEVSPPTLVQQYLKAPALAQAQLTTMAHLWAAAHPEAHFSFPLVMELETIERIEVALSESAGSLMPNSPLVFQAQHLYLALDRLKVESLPYDKYLLLALRIAAFFDQFQTESQLIHTRLFQPNAPIPALSKVPAITEAEIALRHALELAPDFLVVPTFGISLDRQARARLAQVPLAVLAMDAPIAQFQNQLKEALSHKTGTFGADALWLTQVKWPTFWSEFHTSFKSKARRFEKQGVLILLNRLLKQTNHVLRRGSLGLRPLLLQVEIDPTTPRPYENLARQILLGDLGDPRQLGKDPEAVLQSAHKWLLDHVGDL